MILLLELIQTWLLFMLWYKMTQLYDQVKEERE